MNSPFIKTNISNLVNRIKVTPNEYLFPLYEAIVNSIQSIGEAGQLKGRIDIYIKRSVAKQIKTDDEVEKYTNIETFEVIDNGIGFNDINFESFDEVYTGHKLTLGCKGIGRFIALATFLKTTVESTFYNVEQRKYYTRKFEFDISNGITPISLTESSAKECKTKVTLLRYKEKFIKNPNTETVAFELLEHILTFFVDKLNISISIYDDAAPEVISLNKLYEEKITTDEIIDEFQLNNEEFSMMYLKNHLHKTKAHKIHYCGNGRKVLAESLSDVIPNLNRSLEDEKGSYGLSVLVKSNYLDTHLNDYRNEFSIPKKKTGVLEMYNTISIEEINDAVSEKVEAKYFDEIASFREQKNEELKEYIYRDALEYRYLLEHNDLIKTIPIGLPDKEKNVHLHRLSYEFERKQKARVNEFLSKHPDKINDTEEYQTLLKEIIQSESEIGRSKLSTYMVHRKTVLKVLDQFIRLQKNGAFKLESDIHDIIFLRNKSSNQISFNDHNLWILDERIAYNQYIASEKEFNSVEVIESNSSKAADVFIYDNKFVYGEPKDFIILFEFKRPMRTNYTEDEKNLGGQLLKYAKELVGKNSKDASGRFNKITVDTPKFGYIICDFDFLIDDLKIYGYRLTPKGTLFKYEDGINLYIEIMNYNQLLEDSNLRHKAFFQQLGIDTI